MNGLLRPVILSSRPRGHISPHLPHHLIRPRPPPSRLPAARRTYYGYHEPSSSAVSVLWGIIGANTLVFLAWQYALPQRHGLGPFASTSDRRLAQRLSQSFILHANDLKQGRYYTTLTSAFSQIDPYHYLGNMFSLYAFGSVLAACPGVGAAHITTLALGSAIAGSVGWLTHTATRAAARGPWGQRQQMGALGASGMVMGIGAAAALMRPSATMLLMGIVPVPLWALIGGYFVFDSFYLDRGGNVAHAGHLGGLAFGVAFYLLRLRRFGGLLGPKGGIGGRGAGGWWNRLGRR
ncbi:hypothetical protein W97_06084 [Coniosporium apollinis CBS 100218]|uniref:Peptidase S54 rhomboid domain-containing protein n=1 Tax=Coniosporium apollinis (strain CBS 100218) TaxID=1168221 RepID=R7YYP4_CONA1|nr:uncharacterized protein W97_06084 [Coniosporium apollinis CBS 100218]EON66968.1 hypothetical protein W97_06084 [Coniosporium apollinis CBS 100218]